ncbi:MAG: acetyl-CoA C-acyltransferase [Betaproteobacteria bacterium]|nr:MAG: acetyl-CoA C-acyltransferase [Betaproteobacteria bacterium]
MSEQREVVILSGVRTAIGDYGGSLKDIAPTELAARVVKEAVSRAKVDPNDIGQCVFGNVLHGEPKDMYLSRVACVNGGLPHGTGALTDPFDTIHMGVTAENVAARCGISREQQDAFAVESHKRAAAAIAAGHFKSQILPIELKSKKGPLQFDTDEHVRGDATIEGMAKLKAVFIKENGSVTAGNASGINDAAAAVVLMEKSAAAKKGLKPMARLVAYGHAGVDPKIMGLGPVGAVPRALAKAGLKLDQMDVIESNEAFAAQALGVSKEVGMNAAKVNPNGGAIALGHPIGATGCLLTVKAMYELQRTGGRYGLVTMCIGGGQGIAAVIERM